MWTLAFGHHEDRTPTHCYAAIGVERLCLFEIISTSGASGE
jgi:hypothetical protein